MTIGNHHGMRYIDRQNTPERGRSPADKNGGGRVTLQELYDTICSYMSAALRHRCRGAVYTMIPNGRLSARKILENRENRKHEAGEP